MTNTDNKKAYLEILRVIACFFVIINHTIEGFTVNFVEGIDYYIASVLYVMCRTAVPVFLMISGAVLIPKNDTLKKSMIRVVKTILIFVAASSVYYIKYIVDMNSGFSLRDFIYVIWTGEVTNAFWYMYLYIAILIMLPLIRIIAKGIIVDNLYRVYFILWIVFFSIMPLVSKQTGIANITNYFNLSLLSGSVVFFIAGYIIDDVIERKHTKYISIVGVLLFLCIEMLLGALKYFLVKNDIPYYFFDDIKYITVAVPAMLLFYSVSFLDIKIRFIKNAVIILGNLTFGTYLLSDLLIKLLWPVYEWAMRNDYSILCSMILYELSVLILGMAVTFILNSIKNAIFVIGKRIINNKQMEKV